VTASNGSIRERRRAGAAVRWALGLATAAMIVWLAVRHGADLPRIRLPQLAEEPAIEYHGMAVPAVPPRRDDCLPSHCCDSFEGDSGGNLGAYAAVRFLLDFLLNPGSDGLHRKTLQCCVPRSFSKQSVVQ